MPSTSPNEPDTPADDTVDAAAKAMWDAEGGDHPHLTWELLSERSKQHWRRRARAALQAANC
jgi:hypothetical protein